MINKQKDFICSWIHRLENEMQNDETSDDGTHPLQWVSSDMMEDTRPRSKSKDVLCTLESRFKQSEKMVVYVLDKTCDFELYIFKNHLYDRMLKKIQWFLMLSFFQQRLQAIWYVPEANIWNIFAKMDKNDGSGKNGGEIFRRKCCPTRR